MNGFKMNLYGFSARKLFTTYFTIIRFSVSNMDALDVLIQIACACKIFVTCFTLSSMLLVNA